MKKLYIVYDGRAIPWKNQHKEAHDLIKKRQKISGDGEKFRRQFFPGDTDRSVIFETCHTLKEARKCSGEYTAKGGACIYSYDIELSTEPCTVPPKNCLVNEQFVEVI